MVDILDSALAILVYTLAIATVVASVARASFRRYLYLNAYVLAILVADILRYLVRNAYGFTSPQYFYAYFLSDALLAMLIFLLILGFFDILFRHSPLCVPIRMALFVFFLLVAALSYVFVSHSVSHFYSRLVVEFEQNMYFAGLVLTVLLWVSLAHLRVGDQQLRLLITGVGVLLATQAACYALRNMLPAELFLGLGGIMRRIPPIATLGMLSVWCYALAAVPVQTIPPEEARRKLELAGAELRS